MYIFLPNKYPRDKSFIIKPKRIITELISKINEIISTNIIPTSKLKKYNVELTFIDLDAKTIIESLDPINAIDKPIPAIDKI